MKSKRLTLVLLLLPFLAIAERIHWNYGRGYHPFQYATQEGILIDNPTDSLRYDYYKLNSVSKDFSLKFRAKNLHGHPARKYQYESKKGKKINIGNPHWGFFITGVRDTVVFSIKGDEIFTALEPEPCINISLYCMGSKMTQTLTHNKKINPYEGDNLWDLSFSNGNLILSGGDTEINPLIEIPWQNVVTGFGFFAGWGDKILVSDISVQCEDPKNQIKDKFYSIDYLQDYYSKSEDPMEGFWVIFDRELEENLLKLGGDYLLACVKEDDGYSFLYVEGASINSPAWSIGDIKLQLTPSPFNGIYNVVWYDSMKSPLHKDIKAQTGDGNSLLFQFPYQSSKVRLRKLQN